MNIMKFTCSYKKLIQHLENNHYSQSYIRTISTDINWLLKNHEKYKIKSYEHACEIRCSLTSSSEMRRRFRLSFGIFKRFEEDDDYPDYTRKTPLIIRGSYYQLNDTFRKFIDQYQSSARNKGNVKERTIKKRISAGSCFLLKMQNDGHNDLTTINENAVLSFFTRDTDCAKLSSGYKKDVYAVFLENISSYAEDSGRILSYFPNIRPKRKNVQYLQKEETDSIHELFSADNDALSLRNKAIGLLLYFTGMRAGDIVALEFSEIDWLKEIICLNQEKTDANLCLPLTATVGNALYDYITLERPKSNSKYVFLSAVKPFSPLASGSMYYITSKIYQAASVRQNPGDRKGSHLFRHNLATVLAEKGVSRPVISDTLGHTDPNSLDYYLKADIEHLRTCALSIASYPVPKEVFSL